MSTARALYDRYQAKLLAHGEVCASDPGGWHRADVAEFSELRRLLLPHAEAGDMLCQYALATILSMGLCCSSEEEFKASYADATEEATPWWIAAAKQGCWPALDNLVTLGVGAEVERARKEWRQLQRDRPDLVPWSDGMPIYWSDFMQELGKRLYGRVFTD
jgi:hypothetical protein